MKINPRIPIPGYSQLFSILLAGFFFILPLQAQTSLKNASPLLSPDWIGEWEGTLEIWKGKQRLQEVPAYMKISPSDSSRSLLWTTVFGEQSGKQTTKPYELKAIDEEQGLYLLDEHNSILLESYWIKDKLVSWYEVSGNLILASYRMSEADQILLEIIAGKAEPVSVTGGREVDGETIPEVRTFPVSVIQTALFKRIKEK